MMATNNKPWIIIISGPNGAGKSTFYNRILSQNPFLANAEFINYDNQFAVLKQNTQNVDEETLRRHSLWNLRHKINMAFSENKNIIFETTGAGIKQVARLARQSNYKIYGLHINLKNPELSVARVKHRVDNGGHDVPCDVIFERYEQNINRMPIFMPLEDIAIVLDNSNKKAFMPIFILANGYITDIYECPEYLANTHNIISQKYPSKSYKQLLHTQQEIDIKTMSEEQRENFGQIVISNLLGQIR